MRRWHSETALMFGRWKAEMEKHEYDWRNPPTHDGACHCTAGIGSMRKRTPLGCGNPRCGICHYGKFYEPKDRFNETRKAINYELEASYGYEGEAGSRELAA